MEYNLENALEQMRAGEEAGLNYVYSKTYNYVYLRAKNILKKESDIQELMKDVYVQALNRSSEIRKENLYEWLGKCVYSLGCQRFRKKKAREAEILEFEQNEITSRRGEQSEATMDLIHDSLEQLPDLYQATAYAFYYDHMPVKTIAEVMDTEEGVILNRLNYVRRFIMKAMEDYQEEKKEKMIFSVDTICISLRKWSMANCLGMTGAQTVYSEICKEKNLQVKPVYLEGKEFAGVNHTFIQHKPEDLSQLEEQFVLYGEKKSTVEPKKIGAIVLVILLAAALFLGGFWLYKNWDKFFDKKEQDDPTIENQVQNEEPEVIPEDKPEDEPEVLPENEPEVTPENEPEVIPEDEPEDEPEVVPEDKPEVTPQNADYIFPDSNTRLLTREEVASKSKEELRLARNEIFARYGAIFGADDLDQYFRSKSWYKPSIPLSEFYDRVDMNMTEEKNINLIREYEAKF